MDERPLADTFGPAATSTAVLPAPAGASPAGEALRTPVLPEEPRRRGAAATVGIVLAGAALGAVAVAGLTHNSSASTTAAPGSTSQQGSTGTLPGQTAPQQGGLGGSGEQHVQATVTAVGASTLTVQTSAGTATYSVVSQTQIVRDGALVSLSDVQPGDVAVLHVFPDSSGGGGVLERILIGATTGGSTGSGSTGGTTDDTSYGTSTDTV